MMINSRIIPGMMTGMMTATLTLLIPTMSVSVYRLQGGKKLRKNAPKERNKEQGRNAPKERNKEQGRTAGAFWRFLLLCLVVGVLPP